MARITIHGMDEHLLLRLKAQAAQEMTSLNTLALRLLQCAGEAAHPPGLKKFTDLDGLAGTWSEDDAQDFARQSAAFGKVDETLWP